MMQRLVALALLVTATQALAQPLTVHPGETWLFTIENGEPARARQVEGAAHPGRNEVKVSVRALFGTMMAISNNSSQGYNFEARLLGSDGKAVAARTCTLPPGNQPALESWPQKAAAVRLGSFRPASGGHC